MASPDVSASLIKLTDKEFKDIIAFVYKTYGIELSKKRHLIEGRLSFTLKTRGFKSFAEYFALVMADRTKEEMQFFLNKITTNHSYFVRENDHFEYLVKVVLPNLEKTRRRDIRIWSAGCSSGQEAYNIAMAIDQYFGAKKSNWDTTILATDISTNALAKAKTATYALDNLNNMDPAWIKRYFTKQSDGNFQVIEKIRNEVVFKVANLMEPFVFKHPFDIIFCRNVMIYFDNETTQKTIEKFYNATSPGGYFFIGHSEAVDKNRTNYSYLQPAIYQKPATLIRGNTR